jgi:hypothetical protein
MKKFAFAAFSTLAVLLSVQFEGVSAPYHVDNIVLKNFQVIQVAAGAKIVWEFTSEEFDVTCMLEKSTDGVNFVSFRSIQLVSTRQQALHSFIDKEASGQTFYRLRITKQSYLPFISPIVSVNLPQHQQGAYNAGNPVTGGVAGESVFGELSTQDKVMCVQLVAMSGQAKIKQYVKGIDLERVLKPSFSNLPAGYYVVNIKDSRNQLLMNKYIYKF